MTERLRELEGALDAAKKFGAAERLSVENAIARTVRDLDAGLELADLLVEASAAAGVTLDASDVVRECATRGDTGSGRGRKVFITVGPSEPGALIEANPRFAVRLLAFLVALVTGPEEIAKVTVRKLPSGCSFDVSVAAPPERKAQDPRSARSTSDASAISVVVPPVIDLSARVVAGAARIARATVTLNNDRRSASLLLPFAHGE